MLEFDQEMLRIETAYRGTLMSHQEQQEEKIEIANDVRSGMIDEMIDDIKAADMESIFKDYASNLGSTYTLYFDAPDGKERMNKDIEECIELEATKRVDYQLGGE